MHPFLGTPWQSAGARIPKPLSSWDPKKRSKDITDVLSSASCVVWQPRVFTFLEVHTKAGDSPLIRNGRRGDFFVIVGAYGSCA